MIWLAWRQFRTQAAVVVGLLVAIAIVLAVTGPHLVHVFDTTVASCAAHADCGTVTNAFTRSDEVLQKLALLLLFVPALIGIFWGAPLVARELETGTHRLAWTQSVTRMRWLGIKVGLLGLATVAVAGLLSLMVTWWSSPLDRANMNLYGSFDQRGLVPIGYAAVAFALGVTAGVIIRRTLPAMAVTLAVFVAIRVVVTQWVRPHLVAPLHRSVALNPTSMGYGSLNGGPFMLQANPPNIANAWIYSNPIVDRSGAVLTPGFVARACPQLRGPVGAVPTGGSHAAAVPAPADTQAALNECVAKVGATFHEVVTYEPASHYWALQGWETAICLALALALAAISFWWVRHRLS
jgi:hypothetical protein